MHNILLVDDQPEILEFFEKKLQRSDYNVFKSESGENALKIIKDNRDIDIVLLDLVLPGIDGFKVLEKIKNVDDTIEVIIISGKGSTDDVVQLIKNGAFDYIEKPFKMNAIEPRIICALKSRKNKQILNNISKEFENIKALKDYAENVFDNLPVGMISIDNNNKIKIFNKALYKILSLNLDKYINKDINDLFIELFQNNSKIYNSYKNLKENDKHFDDLFLNNSLNGSENKLHFRILGSKFTDGILLFITDITESYNNKQKLYHSEKMRTIGQFVSSITHGLGNNMTNIISNTQGIIEEIENFKSFFKQIIDIKNKNNGNGLNRELIEKFNEKNYRLTDYSKRLLKRTYEMNENVKSLLHYSRNQPKIRIHSDINSIIEDAVNIVKSHNFNKIEFIRKLSSNLPKVDVNPYQIRELFIDLMLNGIQAMKENGRLKYESKPGNSKNKIQVSITDSGNGIPDNIKDKIFSAFFTTKKNGSGLGLANVKNIVSEHSGDIHFETIPEKGTTFFVELPCLQND